MRFIFPGKCVARLERGLWVKPGSSFFEEPMLSAGRGGCSYQVDRIRDEDIRGTVRAWEMFQRYSQRGQTEAVLTYMYRGETVNISVGC